MSRKEKQLPNVPPEMRAMVLHAPRDLRLELRAVPVPGVGEVLVRVGVVGVCGSDVHYFEDGKSGSSVVRAPVVLGHEFGGRIAAVGPGTVRKVGQRVSVEPGIQCGKCSACLRGQYNHCSDMTFLGAAPTDGGMQEYLLVPSDHAFAIPDDMSDEAAALVEPLSVALHGVSRARIRAGDSVLIIGAGPIGVLCAVVAAAEGAANVAIVDPDGGRRDIAASLTRADVLTETELTVVANSFDAVLECSGSNLGLTSAIESVRQDGRIVVLGVGVDRLDVSMNLVQEEEVSITGSHRYRNTWPRAIKLLSTGVVCPEKFVTHRFTLEDGQNAILAHRAVPGVLKAAILLSKD
jgi:L-iditol 2-dehydrogenase